MCPKWHSEDRGEKVTRERPRATERCHVRLQELARCRRKNQARSSRMARFHIGGSRVKFRSCALGESPEQAPGATMRKGGMAPVGAWEPGPCPFSYWQHQAAGDVGPSFQVPRDDITQPTIPSPAFWFGSKRKIQAFKDLGMLPPPFLKALSPITRSDSTKIFTRGRGRQDARIDEDIESNGTREEVWVVLLLPGVGFPIVFGLGQLSNTRKMQRMRLYYSCAHCSDLLCDCGALFAWFLQNKGLWRVQLSSLTAPQIKAISHHIANWVTVTGTKTLIFFFNVYFVTGYLVKLIIALINLHWVRLRLPSGIFRVSGSRSHSTDSPGSISLSFISV